eukprot:1679377-Rhodomonas_salina.3
MLWTASILRRKAEATQGRKRTVTWNAPEAKSVPDMSHRARATWSQKHGTTSPKHAWKEKKGFACGRCIGGSGHLMTAPNEDP